MKFVNIVKTELIACSCLAFTTAGCMSHPDGGSDEDVTHYDEAGIGENSAKVSTSIPIVDEATLEVLTGSEFSGKESKLSGEEPFEKIRSGVEGGGVGAVEINGCTGVLLGTRMILTAAHCFDSALGDASVGIVWTTVSYAATGTTWRCMTGSPANGKCTTNRPVYVRRHTGERPEWDFAAVFPFQLGSSWNNVDLGDSGWGFYVGTLSEGTPYVAYGRGHFHWAGGGAGVMRYMTNTVDWVTTEYFITHADGVRFCHGDSGGPYFLGDGGRWVIGLQSSSDKQNNDVCSKIGGKERGTRTTGTKRQWINQWRSLEGIPACTKYSSTYPDFWVCT